MSAITELTELGRRIKEIRKSEGLSQEKFGNLLGRTQGYVCEIEKGKKTPSEFTIKLIVTEFSIRPEWLLNGKGPKKDGNDLNSGYSSGITEYKLKKYIEYMIRLGEADEASLRRLKRLIKDQYDLAMLKEKKSDGSDIDNR